MGSSFDEVVYPPAGRVPRWLVTTSAYVGFRTGVTSVDLMLVLLVERGVIT